MRMDTRRRSPNIVVGLVVVATCVLAPVVAAPAPAIAGDRSSDLGRAAADRKR
jgi:hypothetical protein